MPRRCRSLSVSSHSEPHAGGVLTNLTVLAVLSGLPLAPAHASFSRGIPLVPSLPGCRSRRPR